MNVDSIFSTKGKADTIAMTKDILQGNVDLLEDKRFSSFDIKGMQAALQLLKQSDPYGDYANDIENNGWRLTYYRKPPTPEEFLTYEWIGPQAETIWPNIKKAFLEFMDPNPLCSYRNLALSVSIGWGKQQPISSDIVVGKTIDVELEDGKTVHIHSDECIEVLKNGQPIKVKANDLLKEDLSGLDLRQPNLGVKIKSVSYSYQKKQLKYISIGEKVLNVDGDYASVWNIQKNGTQQTYLIKLSDGREFRVGRNHLNLIHFRNSKNRPDKKVYDVVPIEYIKDHLGTYVFEIPTEDTFSLKDLDFIQHLEMLPCHEYEPTNEKDILPDRVKDPSKVYIESITDCGEEECWCLQLNDPLGLYITEQGIITHNSLMTVLVLTYIAILFGMMRKPYKLLNHSQPVYENVLLPDGTYTTVGDLKVGMKIAGVTQKESEVLDIIEQGMKETVELELSNNITVRCSMDHLWTVWNVKKDTYEVHSTKTIIHNPTLYLFPEESDCNRDGELLIQAEEKLKNLTEEELALL